MMLSTALIHVNKSHEKNEDEMKTEEERMKEGEPWTEYLSESLEDNGILY